MRAGWQCEHPPRRSYDEAPRHGFAQGAVEPAGPPEARTDRAPERRALEWPCWASVRTMRSISRCNSRSEGWSIVISMYGEYERDDPGPSR